VSGEEALEALESGRFDLVILDVLMPGLGGMATLEKIRERHPYQKLPVIMATAQDQVDGMLKAFELGANDYVIKPVLFPILRARLRTQLELLQALRALEAAEAQIKDLETRLA
jgi:PleD family two-component response regulator